MTSLRPTQRFSLGIATLIGLTMSDSPLPAANYDEAKVPRYELPDSLTMQDGAPVKSAKDWMEKRRPEVLEEALYEHMEHLRVLLLLKTLQHPTSGGSCVTDHHRVLDKGNLERFPLHGRIEARGRQQRNPGVVPWAPDV